MQRIRRTLLAVAIFAIGIALFAWQAMALLPAELARLRTQACLPLEPDPNWQPKPAADFSLPDYSNRSISLSSYRGKVVFLNFWATWCPPCVEEMPSLGALARHYRDRQSFALIAVSEDKGWQEVREFFRQGTPLVVLMDSDWKIAHGWGTEKLPETFLIDKQGQIRHYFINKRDWGSREAMRCIDSLLAE